MQMVINTLLIQSIRVLSGYDYICLVDCCSISSTTSIFHFPEQCGDPSVYLFHHDRTFDGLTTNLVLLNSIIYVHLSSNRTGSTSESLSIVLSVSESCVYYEYTC